MSDGHVAGAVGGGLENQERRAESIFDRALLPEHDFFNPLLVPALGNGHGIPESAALFR
jgi:hypothetical protein